MQVISEVTGLTYSPDEMVYLVNPLQSARYLKHGAVLYDIFESKDMLVFVFSRNDTRQMYQQWKHRELL